MMMISITREWFIQTRKLGLFVSSMQIMDVLVIKKYQVKNYGLFTKIVMQILV